MAEKIWMGWLKRESGFAGYRQTNGDNGNAYGLMQFDRRYALVPFMQYCVDYSNRYDAFKPYISYGAGSEKLKANGALAVVWTYFCDNYPEEFEQLQIAYGYKYYYLEAVKYMERLHGIVMNNHGPVVRGTLWSMAIRSGPLSAARKFSGCSDVTPDEVMLNLAYKTYGEEDAGRWTKAGQWGDALAALGRNEYTDINTNPKEDDYMAKKKVLLIAGHGNNYDGTYDPGACSKWGQEATLARELVTLVDCSIGDSLDVTVYPKNQNCYSYSKNGKAPNYSQFDYVLEIHFNAKTKKDPDGNGSFTGCGGYYHPNNAGRAIADAMVDAIVAKGFKKWLNCTSTGLLNLNRCQAAGVKYFLLETAFIDDGDDMEFYITRKALVAQAIAQTLIKHLGGKGTASQPTVEKYSREQFIRDVQQACGAGVDGIAGPETIGKTVTLSAKKNRKHAAVKPVQRYLDTLGYKEVGEADGVAGPKFTSAVVRYQKEHGCEADGEITAKNKTWRKLLGME